MLRHLWMMILRSPADSPGGAPSGDAGSGAGSGAPASATAAAPNAAPSDSGTPAAPAAEHEIDWNSFTGLDDSPAQVPAAAPGGGLAGPTSETPAASAPQQPAAALATPDGNQPAAATLPTAPVAVTPAQEPPQAAGSEQPAFNPYDPAWQAGHIEALTSTFALSQEQAERLQTEPEKVLPELASRLMLSTQIWVTQFVDDLMQQYIPSLVEGRLTQRETRQTAQTAFKERVVKAYPKLAGLSPEQLLPFTQQIAKAMPQASADERIASLGRAVYAMYGWPLPQSSSQPRPQPAAATPATGVAQTPWMPMSPGAAPPQHAQPAANGRDPNNPWEDLLT